MRKPGSLIFIVLALLSFATEELQAQRNLRKAPKPDPVAELSQFQPAEGFEVNLYAANPLIAKPINMNFDAKGRLWVASSGVYPHIKPGQVPNDRVLILEDTDGDGAADRSTVFADGLLMPTGVVPDDNDGAILLPVNEKPRTTDVEAETIKPASDAAPPDAPKIVNPVILN